jgi:hypothetical protein
MIQCALQISSFDNIIQSIINSCASPWLRRRSSILTQANPRLVDGQLELKELLEAFIPKQATAPQMMQTSAALAAAP